MPRKKKVETTITSVDGCDSRLAELREIATARQAVENWRNQIDEVVEQIQLRLLRGVELDVDIPATLLGVMEAMPEGPADEHLDIRVEALSADVLAFVEKHESEYTGEQGNRSWDLPNGTIGYRLGNPAVKPKPGITETAVKENADWMAALRKLGYVRQPPATINKAEILNDWAGKERKGKDGEPEPAPAHDTIQRRLAKSGLRVLQEDEGFFELARPELHSVAEAGVAFGGGGRGDRRCASGSS